jgi:hypothetical protein
MSRREINKIKKKIRLWCVLHNVSLGDRDTGANGFVYKEACGACMKKNGGRCMASQKVRNNTPLLVLDTKRMRLYRNMGANKINNYSQNNKSWWCVEWVNYV